MTATELRNAINTGKEIIEAYKAEGTEPPTQVYTRMIDLYEKLTEALSIGE